MTTIRFGLGVSPAPGDGHELVATARQAERLGFDFVSASDHPASSTPSYETWTTLTWIAAATSRIGIATRVLGVPYRPPPVVAKMAETLDRLSGGRLILGLGGGWADGEFRAFGLNVPSPQDKVDGLAEAVTVIRGLWSQPEFTFRGRLYRTEAADLEPKPARPIPIWLGTFGPRALAATGRLADGWIPSHGYVSLAELVAMRSRMLSAAAAAGRDPATVTCAYNVAVRIGADEDADVVQGSADEVASQLADFTRLGFTTLNLMPQGADTTDQTERLATEVIPAVRAALC